MHKRIKNWLSNRKQRVVINGTATDWAAVTSDAPQDSVLEPVLFIIYINDINVGLNFIAKSAYNTKAGKAVISDRDMQSLKEKFCKISAWTVRPKMSFNIKK